VLALRIGTVKNSKNFLRVVGPARVMMVGVAKESTETTASSSDPIEHRPANLSRKRPKPSLDKQRELHRVRGFGKDYEERVAGGFNFLAFAEVT
jgi:hypothetical protein